MLPKPPPREGSLGFLYVPPYRVQGTSIAGEATCVQVPELDICFDMGSCPRAMLASKFVAVSHGHMDHVGGLAYYASQRYFQGMGPGTIVCSQTIAPAVRRMMAGFNELEHQVTPYNLIEMTTSSEIELKNNIVLRMFEVEHTCPAVGYVVIEKRSKLRPEFVDFPQEKLRELKDAGTEITRILEVPLVVYMGDTAPGPWLLREDVRTAQIVICECTFVDADHKDRADIGKHIHLDHIIEWLPLLECQKLILTHVSRRSNMPEARKTLRTRARQKANIVEFLMDHKTNQMAYERQVADATKVAIAKGLPIPAPVKRPSRPPARDFGPGRDAPSGREPGGGPGAHAGGAPRGPGEGRGARSH